MKNMKFENKKYNIEGITYSTLNAIAEAYQDNNVTIFALQKAQQREKVGDELIPQKKRKGYTPPPPKNSNGFVVGGIKYKSAADACRKLGFEYGTYRKRLKYGWTQEEVLGFQIRKRGKTYEVNGENLTAREMSEKYNKKLVTVSDLLKRGYSPEQAIDLKPRKRGEKDSQVKYATKVSKKKEKKVNDLKKISKKNLQASKRRDKKVMVGNEEFPSIAAACRFHSKIVESVRTKLYKGASLEQALGLETWVTSKSVKFQGKIYPSKKYLATGMGLKLSQIYSLPKHVDFETAVNQLLHKKTVRGRRNVYCSPLRQS